ncbi:hypothetical protein BKA80DRAFT_311732 [Phyllosticta citrichinensis]
MSQRRSVTKHAHQRGVSPSSARPEAGARADSQASESPDIRLLMDKMLDDSKKRKQAKRQALQNDYAKRAQKVSNDIKAAIDEHEKQRQAEQKQQVARLIELLKKRDDVERRIQESVKKLDTEYSACLNELLTVLDDKAAELN